MTKILLGPHGHVDGISPARLPISGDIWPEAERKLWLQLLEGSFKLIYKDTTIGTAAIT
jgi:hypothetical protein